MESLQHSISFLTVSFHPWLLCKHEAFCSWKEHTVFSLSWSVLNLDESCHSHMDSSDVALWMLIQSLSRCWKCHGNVSPSFPLCISFDDCLQKIDDSEKEHFHLQAFLRHVGVYGKDGRKDEGGCIYVLVESGLCLNLTWSLEAVLWRPGISASRSSSSGRRTARSWRERWQQTEWAQRRLPAPVDWPVGDPAVWSTPSQEYPEPPLSYPCWRSDAVHTKEKYVFLFGKGKHFTSLVNVCNFTTKASVFPLVNSSVWEEPNFVVHKNVLTMFHRPLLPLLVFTLPLSLLLSFVFLVCGACWSQAPHLISLLHFRLRPALNVWG